MRCLWLLVLPAFVGASTTAGGQENYEIQVYPYETVERGRTMVELHSNFTFRGRRSEDNGVLPTNHQLHETIEVTHGFNGWFELGLYLFTSRSAAQGLDWVGNHIRPRVRVPESWHWPVGVSLSNEVGYQRRRYATDTWTWEMRPIVDKQLGRWYLSLNPTLGRSLHGESAGQGFVFSPNLKVSYDFTKAITGGIEYYGSVGPLTGFDPIDRQQHQIFPAIDLNLSPKWEVNFGLGVGLTKSTDRLIAKLILGYRLH
jgi:hypothetical protein